MRNDGLESLTLVMVVALGVVLFLLQALDNDLLMSLVGVEFGRCSLVLIFERHDIGLSLQEASGLFIAKDHSFVVLLTLHVKIVS